MRASSSSRGTGSAPGRVDSPPTSRMSARAMASSLAVASEPGAIELAAVGEAVGRGVEDAHQPGRVEREPGQGRARRRQPLQHLRRHLVEPGDAGRGAALQHLDAIEPRPSAADRRRARRAGAGVGRQRSVVAHCGRLRTADGFGTGRAARAQHRRRSGAAARGGFMELVPPRRIGEPPPSAPPRRCHDRLRPSPSGRPVAGAAPDRRAVTDPGAPAPQFEASSPSGL